MSPAARFDRREGIARNTAYALAVQLATSFFTAAVTLFLVRALEPKGYGLLALALAIGGLLYIPSDIGISGSASRFIAEARTDRVAAARVISDALVLKVAAAVISSTALFVAADWLAGGYGETELVWPLRAIAIALFGQSVMSLVRANFVALGRISVNFRLVLSESAVEAAATIGLVLLGTGAAGAAWGRAVGYTFGAVLAVGLLIRVFGRGALAFREFRWRRARRMARYAGAIAVVDGAWVAFGQVDALVIGGVLGAGAVGAYQAPMRFIIFLQYPGLAIAYAIAPRLARNGDDQSAIAAFVPALRYLMMFQALLIAPLVVWAVPITEILLGPGYEESADVLRALTPFVFLSGLASLLSLAANYLGEARRRIPIAVATLALDIVLALVLVPAHGIVGAAIATDVAYLLYAVGHLWICLQILPISLRPILVAFARSAAAAAAMAGVLIAIGTSDLSVGDWIVGALGGTAAFAAVLVATGGLRRADVAAVRSALARVRS